MSTETSSDGDAVAASRDQFAHTLAIAGSNSDGMFFHTCVCGWQSDTSPTAASASDAMRIHQAESDTDFVR